MTSAQFHKVMERANNTGLKVGTRSRFFVVTVVGGTIAGILILFFGILHFISAFGRGAVGKEA